MFKLILTAVRFWNKYHYNFGKLYEGSSKYAELVVYEQDGAVIYFSYISTN